MENLVNIKIQQTFFELIDCIQKEENNIKTNDNIKKELIKNVIIKPDFKNNHKENKQDKTNFKNKLDITSINDFFISRENLSSSMKERYENNIKAIKLLKTIEKQGRVASSKEQSILGKYSGFGGFASKFNNKNSNLELERLLEEDYDSIKKSVLTSYYTNLNIIKFIHKVISKLGFDKGRILEPSIGTGRFLGGMNEETYYNSRITGIEIDSLSSRFAKNLYQNIEVINSAFENVELKDESFDLILSNIPFGDIPVFGESDTDLNSLNLNIHDYYFIKSIKKLRDGGLLAFATTTYVLDKENDKVRRLIDKECNLIGAVRLPINTFLDTSVSVDILFLQKDKNKTIKYYKEKCDDDTEDYDRESFDLKRNDFLKVVENEKGVGINEYYIKNPHMMLGTLEKVSSKYGEKVEVVSKKKIETKDFDKLLKFFPYEIYESSFDDTYMYEDKEIIKEFDKSIREGEFVLVKESIYQRQGNNLVPKKYNGKRKDIFIKYIHLKDKIKELIEEELDGCSDSILKALQLELNGAYDEFASEYGYINSKNNKKFLQEDVLYYLLCSLEEKDSDSDTYYKTEIFTNRVICKSKIEEKPNCIDDAVMISYNNRGNISIPYIANMMNTTIEDITKTLKDKRFIYYNPINNEYESRDEYLSGNVKHKLRYLEENFADNDEYKANIEDLKLNQPEYVYDVYFDICSTWIPLDVKANFIKSTLELKDDFKLTYSHAFGYKTVGSYYVSHSLNYIEWGTSRREALDIVLATMNMKSMIIYDTVDDPNGDEKRVKNPEETQLALEKQNKWKLAFSDFIMSDIKLYKDLVDLYNEKCVLFKEREYKNIFNNLKINPNIKLMEHQLKGASRIITSNNNTLLCHSVGAGKSYTSILSMAEWSRIGKYKIKGESDYRNDGTKKIGSGNIMFVVPNALCMSGQFAKEYLKLYPQANILSTTPNDFTRANRRKTLGRMLMKNWDSIIIPHSVLGLIPIKPESELKLLKEDEKELIELINYYYKEDDKVTVKEIEKKLEKHRVRMKRLMDMKKDMGLVYWEDLNIDRLVVDESQFAKNLAITTKLSRINGVAISPSKRAKDLHNKIRLHREIYGERGIVFLSATPISNSISEIYIINEFLGKEILKDCEIFCFDDFASRYGEVVASMEIDVTGQNYRVNQRFSKFKNVPELATMFRLISDVVFTEEIKDIKVPQLANGKPTVINVEPTKEMQEYIEELVERAEKIWQGLVKPREDNMLNVVTSGRLLAVSPRLVGLDGESPKIDVLCNNVYDLYVKYPKCTQTIFCDLGTPNGETYCVYDEIKNNLINLGINKDEIAYIHDGNTDIKRKSIVDAFNKGKIKILMGSTQKMGIGQNLQKLLRFSHHVDCPWKSSEIEQRDGRILRQGNKNNEVEIFRYICKQSFDAYSWQCVERKARFIKQIISNTTTAREVEDVDMEILSYSEAKACACGDKRIMRLCEINNEVQRLQLLEKAFKQQKIRALSAIDSKKKYLNENLSRKNRVVQDLKISNSGDGSFVLAGNRCKDTKELTEKIQKLLTSNYKGIVGEVSGLKIKFEKVIELGVKYYKVYLGNTISFNSKKSAKVVIQNLSDHKKILEEKIKTYDNISERLTKEIQTLSKNTNTEFTEKDKLNDLLGEKKHIELELAINKEKF